MRATGGFPASPNAGLTSGQYSDFAYTTMPENLINGISETSDVTSPYPNPPTQAASYNNLNQLSNLSGQAYSYDTDGNLLSDGTLDYSWDAENRLVAITYPGEPGRETQFTYDGLSRRTAIASTPAGGGPAVTTSYIWCGSHLCQVRDASGAMAREYEAEGEYVPGSPAQPYYYGSDQLGSVRRVFASTSNAPGYGYDAWGNPLQTTAPLTDFTYADMFYNADSGLDLTQYRAYNRVIGRWLSRDPIGEAGDQTGNLYAYVGDDPINHVDQLGLWTVNIGVSGSVNIPLYGPVGIGGAGFAGIAFDSQGNFGGYYGGGGGLGGGAGISGGLKIGGSNGATICDLGGPFGSLGGAGGEGIVAGGEGYTGSGSHGQSVTGGNGFIGLGAGTPVSGTGSVTYTYVHVW